MRNREFITPLRTRISTIYLDVSPDGLGSKMEGKKQKGDRRAWKTACPPQVEETGEGLGHGTESVPPERRRKVLYEFYKIF
jgi:hypothetical protein